MVFLVCYSGSEFLLEVSRIKKRELVYFLLLILFFSQQVLADTTEDFNGYQEDQIARGKVLEIMEQSLTQTEQLMGIVGKQLVLVEILSGEYRGLIKETENILPGNPRYDILVHEGDEVLLVINDEEGVIQVYITDFARDRGVYILVALFILALIIIGGVRGLKALFSLVLTVFFLFRILLPLVLRGYNPLQLTILITIALIVIILLIIGGWNKKTAAAIIGTAGGVFLAGILAFYFGNFVNLTGLSTDEAQMLLHLGDAELDFRGVLFAGMIIGALGAIMDIGISIASTLEEIKKNNPFMELPQLFSSGMNVGRDIMGTMTNTLILAYVGGTMPLIMLLMNFQPSILRIINMDLIATEIVRAMAGSVGLVISIPLTAFMGALLFGYFEDETSELV